MSRGTREHDKSLYLPAPSGLGCALKEKRVVKYSDTKRTASFRELCGKLKPLDAGEFASPNLWPFPLNIGD